MFFRKSWRIFFLPRSYFSKQIKAKQNKTNKKKIEKQTTGGKKKKTTNWKTTNQKAPKPESLLEKQRNVQKVKNNFEIKHLKAYST